MYKQEIKEKAIGLRKRGYSIKEVAKILNIGVGTSSLWLKDIKLNKSAEKRLQKRRILGQYNARKTSETKRKNRDNLYTNEANKIVDLLSIDNKLAQIFCSLLYWAEGAKFMDNHLEFTNSDPRMIGSFLRFLRKGFNIDEQKLRVNIHVHEYHKEKELKTFWSKITGIPISQFNQSYLKKNTHKRIRENYMGCVRICYYSGDTARKVKALYTALAVKS